MPKQIARCGMHPMWVRCLQQGRTFRDLGVEEGASRAGKDAIGVCSLQSSHSRRLGLGRTKSVTLQQR